MIYFFNAISDAVLAVVCIVAFFRFFARQPFYHRMLWGIFLVTTALAAAAGVFRYLGLKEMVDTHRSLSTLAGSVGLVAVVVAIWALVMQQSMPRWVVIISVVVGLLIFVTLLKPTYQVFGSVIQAFTMLLVMLIAVFGLMKKYQKAVWIVVGVMIIGLATKVASNHLPLNPTDVYHYALAAMILCFGKAV
jgi:hypothetical protein